MSKTKTKGKASVKLNLDDSPGEDGPETETPETETPETETPSQDNPSQTEENTSQEPPAQTEAQEQQPEDDKVSTDTSRGGRYISLGGGKFKRVDEESTNE